MKKDAKSTQGRDNDAQPATTRDVRRAQEELAITTGNAFANAETRLTNVQDRLDRIETTMATKDDLKNLATKGAVETILAIVDENNQLLKELRHLPDRVARLERSVFRR